MTADVNFDERIQLDRLETGGLRPVLLSNLVSELEMYFPDGHFHFHKLDESKDTFLVHVLIHDNCKRVVLELDCTISPKDKYCPPEFGNYECYYNLNSEYPKLIAEKLSELTDDAQSQAVRSNGLFKNLIRGALELGPIQEFMPFTHPIIGGTTRSGFYIFCSNKEIVAPPYVYSPQFEHIFDKKVSNQEAPIFGFQVRTSPQGVDAVMEITKAREGKAGEWFMLHGSSSMGIFTISAKNDIINLDVEYSGIETLRGKCPGTVEYLEKMIRASGYQTTKFSFNKF